MKITEVEEFALSFKRENAPRRGVGQPIKKDTVIVRVKTEDGIVGYGEAHHALAPTLVADLVNQNLSALIVLGVMLFAPAVPAPAADWKPEKTVEIVVNTPPGNSPDRTARVMQGILQDKKHIDVPVAVNNKLGGGGVVAYTYLNFR